MAGGGGGGGRGGGGGGARPATEPTTSWFLVGFVNHCAITGTPIGITILVRKLESRGIILVFTNTLPAK